MAIPNGGLIPARLIANEIQFFNSELHQDKNILTYIPQNANNLLIIDDIYDSGQTYEKIKKIMTKKFFVYVTLVQRDKKVPHNVISGKNLNGDPRWIRFPWEKTNEKRRRNPSTVFAQ